MLRRLRVRELGLVLASLTCLALFLEVAARLLLPPTRYHDAPVEFDPNLGFRGIPGYRSQSADARGVYPFELNEHGFRGRALPSAGEQAELRVLYLGDSFLVGEAVRAEELMTARVEAGLSARGIDAEVYNLSVIDYGTAQELLLLDAFGPQIRPDVVVLALFSGNDVINNSMELANQSIVSRGDSIRPYLVSESGSLRVRFLNPILAKLRAYSRVVTEIERRLLSIGERYEVEWLQATPTALPLARRLRSGLAPSEAYELFRSHDPEHPWEIAWRATQQLLLEFRDRTRALGARPLVLVIPTHDQVVRSARMVRMDVMSRRFAGRSLADFLDWNLPERRLEAFLRDAGIDALFLLPTLRTAAQSGASPYAMDEHLSEEGHAIAAEKVLEWFGRGDPTPLSPESFTSAPITSLPPASDVGPRLSFARSEHRENLGHGWLLWRPEAEGGEWGWWIGARALVVLPAAGGDLVVRGSLPAGSKLPLRGFLHVIGGIRYPFALEEYGPFELRLPSDLSPRPTSTEGYVAIGISPGVAQVVNGEPVGFLVREIGFEAPR